MKKLLLVLCILLVNLSCFSQKVEVYKQDTSNNQVESSEATNTKRPRLVVGIVVDQMRYDYLTRFNEKYGENGFKRLIKSGFNCKNNHFNYIPTYTGPGHASVYTGTTPKYHGIIANNWYDKVSGEFVYCAGDSNYKSVGTEADAGEMSPHRMQTTTFSDENRLFTQMRGKTIGISIKDRGAILPAGHTANAAYWFHGKKEGNFITSSFYTNVLPKWVQEFNDAKYPEKYLKPWNTLYDISTYTESGRDLNNYEGGFKGKENATFPYDLKALKAKNGDYDILKVTPYGNSLVTDFALAAIKGEDLGKDDDTDVLAISYSSPDYIGHNFGVNSKEIQDTYIRLDLELERLLNALDSQVGKGNYIVFLTADHGAVEVPAYLENFHIPAGYLNNRNVREEFSDFMKNTFNSEKLIANVSNNQVFLSHLKLKELNLDLEDVQNKIVEELITYDHVYKVYTAKTMASEEFTTGVEELLQLGYHQKRSGDILIVGDPAFISYSKTGSTHGSGFNYDTHVPLIFYGFGINKGETLERTEITDLAPTISALLNISFPNGAIGTPIEKAID
ncbi:MAG: alkaline phosphatase family protein [Flavobacteriaceae bacterium]|nr:alkaline phosphatase family protein [Flavobacteriaceae bacterium]